MSSHRNSCFFYRLLMNFSYSSSALEFSGFKTRDNRILKKGF